MKAPIASCVASPSDEGGQAQDTADPDALNRRVEQLYLAARYVEATEIAKQSLALAERKFGAGHPVVAKALNTLATLYFVQGHDADAEPLFKGALAILKKALGPGHPAVAAAQNYLAELRIAQGERARAAGYRWRSPETASLLSSVAPHLHAVSRRHHGQPSMQRPHAISLTRRQQDRLIAAIMAGRLIIGLGDEHRFSKDTNGGRR